MQVFINKKNKIVLMVHDFYYEKIQSVITMDKDDVIALRDELTNLIAQL